MGHDELPAADMAALREAVLGCYEESVRPLVGQRRRRMARRLHRRGLRRLNALLLPPWLLVGLVYLVATGRASAVVARQQRAVGLYRRLSGKDPHAAEAEVGRVKDQLLAIDQRVKPYGARLATAEATADRVELAAAAGALLAYHLRGRRTEDALLGEIQAAWVELMAVGWSRSGSWESYEAWRRWFVQETGRGRPAAATAALGPVARRVPGVLRARGRPDGGGGRWVEPAAVAAAERAVRWRARAFLVKQQERIARHPDHYPEPVVFIQVSFEAGPGRWPTLGCGEMAAPPTAPRRSMAELVAVALEGLGG